MDPLVDAAVFFFYQVREEPVLQVVLRVAENYGEIKLVFFYEDGAL